MYTAHHLMTLTHCDTSAHTRCNHIRLFQCESSREEAMFGTRIVVDIIECLSHKNIHIKRAADRATELGTQIVHLLSHPLLSSPLPSSSLHHSSPVVSFI